jgi:hypothetical protein
MLSFALYGQRWSTVWTSGAINYTSLSGYLYFKKTGTTWEQRIYTLDVSKFQVMNAVYSTTPEYTYTFSAADTTAGRSIYSLGYDLTGDGITEFYILSYYGVSTNYRQSFKIFDVTNGNILFQKNDASYSYSYPVFDDLDGNGAIEMYYTKYEYPLWANYYYEVVNTGLTGDITKDKPNVFRLGQNYPNPFNPETTITFELDHRTPVKLQVFSIGGELVKTLYDNEAQAGKNTVVWDGTDDAGRHLPSGPYFYSLDGGAMQLTRKMILLK